MCRVPRLALAWLCMVLACVPELPTPAAVDAAADVDDVDGPDDPPTPVVPEHDARVDDRPPVAPDSVTLPTTLDVNEPTPDARPVMAPSATPVASPNVHSDVHPDAVPADGPRPAYCNVRRRSARSFDVDTCVRSADPGHWTVSADPTLQTIRFHQRATDVNTPLVWAFAPDGVLWLSHSALQGRTGVTPSLPGAIDILVGRDGDGHLVASVRAVGFNVDAVGVAPTATGILVTGHALPGARTAARDFEVRTETEATLWIDRSGAVTRITRYDTAERAMALQGPDGRAWALLAARGSVRVGASTVALGPGLRLVLVAHDASGVPTSALDLGSVTTVPTLATIDPEGLRVRVGDLVQRYALDGRLLWVAYLPGFRTLYHRDGSTWAIARVTPYVPAGAHDRVDLVIDRLSPDGRALPRIELRYPRLEAMDRVRVGVQYGAVLSWSDVAVFDFAQTLNGEVQIRTRGSASWEVQCIYTFPLNARFEGRWCFDASGAACSGRVEPAAPRCIVTDAPSGSGWAGALLCRRPCAADGTCAPIHDDTDAHCGWVGESCVHLSGHNAGRCSDSDCVPVGCEVGYADCDGDDANGCEVDLGTSTSNCGACGNRCDGACVGGRCCVGARCAEAVFDSDGHEGAFEPTTDVELSSGVHHFTRVFIPAGVVVTAGVGGLLDLRATEDIRVEGIVDVAGGGGVRDPTAGLLGGETGRCGVGGGPDSSGSGPGGGGSLAAGARGAAPGARGAIVPPSLCTSQIASPPPESPPPGGGPLIITNCSFRAPTCSPYDPGWRSLGTSSTWGRIGERALHDLAVASTFEPGSGGGSMSVTRWESSWYGDRGGGGGGGGALRLASRSRIVVGVAARLLADGGPPSSAGDSTAFYAGASPGSGGVIYLAAPDVSVASGARLSAVGGADTRHASPGRIRISVDPARCHLDGTFTPPLAAGCRPNPPGGNACHAYVGVWPL